MSINTHTTKVVQSIFNDPLYQPYFIGYQDMVKRIKWLHRGIGLRKFTRQFTLADTVEVTSAEMVNGLLKVWLEDIIPDEQKPRKVNIK